MPNEAPVNNQGLKSLMKWGMKKDGVSVSLDLEMTHKVEVVIPTPMVGMITGRGSTVLKTLKEQT